MWAASSNSIPMIIWIQSRLDYYDRILSRYNPYFKSLLPDGRRRFIQRVLDFIESKEFEYIDIEAEASMPVLVSAAAIQLTYGLDQ